MIWQAVEAGADIIKGQILFSEDLTHRPRFDEGEIAESGVRKTLKRPYAPEFDRIKSLDLTPEDYHFFVEEVYRAGKTPLLTVMSRNRIPLAASLPWRGEKAVKIASFDCASDSLLRETAPHFDKFLVSTGATLDEEISATAEHLKKLKRPFAYLHCVTNYPNTLAMCNLSRMEWLKQFTPEVGWSDHTLVARDGNKASMVAAAHGADFIERHFTILAQDKTKDGPVSINPTQLRELRRFVDMPKKEQLARMKREVPEWEIILGVPQRELTHTEMLNRDYYRGRWGSPKGNTWVTNWDVLL